ncbi:flagellar basal body L-ring protein FlgH [Noviherbaspirillum galbum]|uniref:Flagellar L-ring protein n=1 Tax=Noviherbaspirillum galbum TaxID=2709383 RepID=A0A6B3SPV9_9BURK|nr:flagellar basal body L-ring protein FlgH [Noviherbaspirillum galbum]NEX62681.1 flagellar basal body L-ring protein FlgH [Noviherbaspirillum galbum]
MNRLSTLAISSMTACLLAACGTTPPSIIEHATSARPILPATPTPSNGAIFQAAAYRPLFEDRRARLVGDMVTVTITESTSAVKNGANSGSRSGSLAVAMPGFLGRTGAISGTGSIANKFEDKEAATASNTFSGTMTATVVEVLPNGNLVISGEKQVAFDKATEYVRMSGVVSPDRIGTGNVVSSAYIADARIEYRTNSRIDKAEFMSQVARFFMSVMPL